MACFNLSEMLNRKASPARTSKEICGKCFVGCTRPKTGKKFPSRAAEYGTRDAPSKTENAEATAIHKIIPVTKRAAACPYNRSTNKLAMKSEFCASRHGTTPRRLVCIARY